MIVEGPQGVKCVGCGMAKGVLGPGGRIAIPAEYRRAFGMCVGDRLFVEVVDGGLRIMTPRQAIKRAQALFGSSAAEDGQSFVDELIAERRAEADRE